MRIHFLRVFFFISLSAGLCLDTGLYAQVNQSPTLPAGNTYAVIVGISKYETPGIGRLDFAHRDAQEFARFLQSKAGGSVPEGNIRLLLNNDANYIAIYNALYWLQDTCKKNDVVYFYFSGHGDVENRTVYKLGFLLAANTPRFNYINSAVRIEDLNDIANTISQKGTRVILVTDACHSGDLAGKSNRGNFLVGDQLRAVTGNEIRITSCGPDQLSNEDEGWGGGRGVFSYYLVKGLEGSADASKDQVVTVKEVRDYLNSALASDRLMATKEHKQNPVITGADNTGLVKVDPSRVMVTTQQRQESENMVVAAAAPLAALGLSPMGTLFSLAVNRNIEKLVDFNLLSQQSKEEIPFSFIKMLTASVKAASPEDSIRIERLPASLKSNPDILKRFNEKLVELFADRGQEIINLYMDGDEAELERRRYYNSVSNGYDIYPKMFATALKLVPPQQTMLYHILEVKLHYFAGVAARLKMPLADKPFLLLDTAIREQMKAYKLQENAAYIQNELGILNKHRKDYVAAEKYFLRATQIAPAWALPWSNLAGLYIQKDSLRLATETIEKARQLQPDYSNIYINSGLIYEKKKEQLYAEEMYRKAIKLNSRHYLPFEKLAYIGMNTAKYAEANTNFYEADLRKKGFNFVLQDADVEGITDQFDVESPPLPCTFDSTRMNPDDFIAQFYLARYYFYQYQLGAYEHKLRQVIRLDHSNPIGYKYLGELLYRQQRWKEAAVMLEHSLTYYLDKDAFSRYTDSLKRIFPQYNTGGKHVSGPIDFECVFMTFFNAWFEKQEPRFLLGTAYERWNHFAEAERQFRDIIKDDSFQLAAYYKLWHLLENTNRYYDAEAVIRFYPLKKQMAYELYPFYQRAINRYPGKGEWYYKAGTLLYDLAMEYPDLAKRDRKRIIPDFEIERYQDSVIYEPQDTLLVRIPATGEIFKMHSFIHFPRTDGIEYLEKADSLTAEEDMLADINTKIGDLYMGQELPQRADRYYKKAVDLFPADADTRIKLRNVYSVTYQYRNALEQLDTLQSRGEIDFTNQVLLAEYCMANSRFAEAKKFLDSTAAVHPYSLPGITDLQGRLYMLMKNPAKAIPYYKNYLELKPGDADATYSIARLYARSGNKTEAWKWLSTAVDKGFRYYWVLLNDESWEGYRGTAKWKEINGRYELNKN